MDGRRLIMATGQVSAELSSSKLREAPSLPLWPSVSLECAWAALMHAAIQRALVRAPPSQAHLHQPKLPQGLPQRRRLALRERRARREGWSAEGKEANIAYSFEGGARPPTFPAGPPVEPSSRRTRRTDPSPSRRLGHGFASDCRGPRVCLGGFEGLL
jgi:hypothetical protein